MNLSNFFERDAAIVDHDWMAKGLTEPEGPDGSLFDFDAIKNPNNIGPELEVQWGGGDGAIEFSEPAGIVQRNLPDDAEDDANNVIIFARDQMNRGVMGRDLTNSIREKFSSEAIRKSSEGLREQFKLEGIVGCIAIDGRGYESCQEALKVAENSPNKRFIRYVIGCQCGDPQEIVADSQDGLMDSIVKSTGNAADDFLANTQKHAVKLVSHCRSTMLPIMGQDIDPSEVDSGLIDLVRVNDLPDGEVEKLEKDRHNDKYSSNKSVLQAAFRRAQALREASEEAPYVVPVDASDFRLHQADNEIEFTAEAMPDIDIDTVPAPVEMGVTAAEFETQEIDMSPLLAEEFEGTDVIDLDVLKAREGDLDVGFADPSGGITI